MDTINVIITYLDNHDWVIVLILAVVSGLSFLYFRKKDSMDNTIDVSIDIAPKKEKNIVLDNEKKDMFKIDYIMNKSNQHTQIIPKLKYLELINMNDEISAIDINKSLISLSPSIYIKITNNKQTTLKIDKIKLDVAYSQSIEAPLPVFNYMLGGKPFEVIVQNLGWGRMLNTSLKFDFFLNKDDKVGFSQKSEGFTENIGTIDNIKYLDISNIFKEKWGFDIQYLSSNKIVTDIISAKHANISDKYETELRSDIFKKIFTAYGSLKNKLSNKYEQPVLHVHMRGQLSYQYKLRDEIIDATQINFLTPIWICNKVGAGPIEPSIYSRYTLELESNKENYNLLIDDSYAIKPNETEVIQITFNNEQSSKHKINISVFTNQGELDISNDILLEILKFKDNK